MICYITCIKCLQCFRCSNFQKEHVTNSLNSKLYVPVLLMASGGLETPPPIKRLWLWFFDLADEILSSNFLKRLHGSGGPRELSRDLFPTGVKRSAIFEIFEHISESFQYLFYEIYFGSKILSSSYGRHRKFGDKCSSYPGKQFLTELPVFGQTFYLGQWLLYENSDQSMYSYV